MTQDLEDGESIEVSGSGSARYRLKNTGGAYSCSCPAWRNQGGPPERRTCKHLRALRGDEAESARLGAPVAASPRAPSAARAASEAADTAEGAEPPLLLAHSWDGTADLDGYWMSEKLDGVRAYWDGERFLSRLGNVFHVPDWFKAGLPTDVPLDGELFSGRKAFQRTVSIVRRQDRGEAWREISYVMFDAPALKAPFEERIARVEEVANGLGAHHVRAHPHERCRGTAHLREELARVEALGGEGLMLRKPGSFYEVGRSSTLLKVKSFFDREARVVGHVPGAGRHAGRLGALACELPDGTRFSIGTGLSDAERRNPPPIGAIVTFRYQELSNDGVPRFPSYVGVRDDVRLPGPPPAPPEPKVTATADRVAAMAEASRAARAAKLAAHVRELRRGESVAMVTLRGLEHEVRRDDEVEVFRHANGAAAWRAADEAIRALVAEGFEEKG